MIAALLVACVAIGIVSARPIGMLAVILAVRYPSVEEIRGLWPGPDRTPAERGSVDLAFVEGAESDPTTVAVSRKRATSIAVVVALAAASSLVRWSYTVETVVGVLLALVLIIVSLIDLDHSRIPDRVVWPSVAFSAALAVVGATAKADTTLLVGAITGAAAFFGLLYIPFSISEQSMGFGDVKLALLLGLHLGWAAENPLGALVLTMVALLIASLIGVGVGGVLYVARRRSEPFPFGPALALSTWLALLGSTRILGA